MKKILKLDSAFRVIEGDGIEILDALPKGIYELKYSDMQGFWLERMELEPFPGKVYGDQVRMTDKVVRRYADTSGKNLGVLLSGQKGTGKSLFVRNLAVKLSAELPVIVVKANHGRGMLSMLANVKGRAAIVFDEFEKMFRGRVEDGHSSRESDIREQETALSFFDGVETRQEKLLLLTVNETYDVSRYLLGRPGRIYYHFRMTIPTYAEIKEYLADNLDGAHHGKINDIAMKLVSKTVSWDSLAAVAREVNAGETLEDTMKDLNISSDVGRGSTELTLKAVYEDGEEVVVRGDFSDADEEVEMSFNRKVDRSRFSVEKIWTNVLINVADIEPTGAPGEFKARTFEQDPAEDIADHPVEGAPKIVEVYVYRSVVLDSMRRYAPAGRLGMAL